MATLENRVVALEQSANQNQSCVCLIICKGSEPTPEQTVEAEQAEAEGKKVLMVTYHQPTCRAAPPPSFGQ